jgi:hypothetical protein
MTSGIFLSSIDCQTTPLLAELVIVLECEFYKYASPTGLPEMNPEYRTEYRTLNIEQFNVRLAPDVKPVGLAYL